MHWLRDALSPGWVGSLIGLLSLIIALILYKASLVGARPVHQRRALRLIGPDAKALYEGVEVRFKGQVVERLTKTQVVFWNSGRTLLRGSDVVDTDPVRCDFADGSRVLDARILKITRPANKFEVSIDPERPQRVLFTFDYLDPGDGVVVEILHTDLERYPKVNGTIRGVPRGIADWGAILRSQRSRTHLPLRRRPLVVIAFTISALFVASGVLVPEQLIERLSKAPAPASLTFFRFLLVSVGALYAVLPVLLLWRTRRRFPRSLGIPEFEE